MTIFEQEIETNVKATIRKIKRQGTVGMSLANLRQITPTPKATDGAPQGTNAAYVYAQLFDKVASRIKVQGFDIYN